MVYSLLTTKDWQERLETKILFAPDLRGSLESITHLEFASMSKLEEAYIGHSRLADTAVVFFLHTLEQAPKLGPQSTQQNLLIPLVLVDLLMMLRKLRSSVILGGLGYPGPAFSLLRDAKDKAILLSAVFQGTANYAELNGVDPTIDLLPRIDLA